MPDYEIFELGDVVLQSGLTLRQAKLAYKTYGKLAASHDNVIINLSFVQRRRRFRRPEGCAGAAGKVEQLGANATAR